MLKTLRTKSRKLMLGTLILVIPSFIFFYGWSGLNRDRAGGRELEIGRYQPMDSSKWREINSTDLYYSDWELSQEIQNFIFQQKINQYMQRFGAQFMQQLMQDGQLYQIIQSEINRLDRRQLVPTRDLALHFLDLHALERFGEKQDVTVSQEEVHETIRTILQGYTTDQQRRMALQNMGLNTDIVIPFLSRREYIDRARSLVLNKAMVSRYELWKEYRLQNEEITLSYVPFDLSTFRDQVELDNEAMALFYAENKEQFRVADQRRYRYAYVHKDSLADQVVIGEDAIREYFEANLDDFMSEKAVKVSHIHLALDPEKLATGEASTTVTLEQARDIRRQLDEGADFAALANQFSQDPANTVGEGDAAEKRGGVIEDWITEEQFDTYGYAFISSALDMEAGDISDPVYMRGGDLSGYSIIQIREVRAPEAKPLESVQAEIREILHAEKLDALFTEKVAELRDKMKNTQYSSVDLVAKDLAMETGETSYMLKTEAMIPLTTATLRIQPGDLEFINTQLTLQTVQSLRQTFSVPYMTRILLSRNLEGNDSAAYVLQLVEEKPSHVPPFDEVRDEVSEAYKTSKGRERMQQAARDFLDATAKAESMEKAAEEAGGELLKTESFSRFDPPSFAGGQPMDSVGVYTHFNQGDTGIMAVGFDPESPTAYVAWRLDAAATPSKETFEQEHAALRMQLAGMKQAGFLEEWLLDQRRKMKIDIQ